MVSNGYSPFWLQLVWVRWYFRASWPPVWRWSSDQTNVSSEPSLALWPPLASTSPCRAVNQWDLGRRRQLENRGVHSSAGIFNLYFYVCKQFCSIAHPLTDGYAESEQPLGVRCHDEVALASVQRRYHGVPTSLAVLNLRKEKRIVNQERTKRKMEESKKRSR